MAAKKGSEIRIQLKPDLFMDLTGINIESDQVCGTAVFILSKKSWDVFEEDMYWVITRLCTTGKMYRMRMFLGAPENIEQLFSDESAVWFSRNMVPRTSANNPVFCSSDVTPCGSINDVISGVEQGAYITIYLHHSQATSFLVYGSRFQILYNSTCEAAVLLQWHLNKRSLDAMQFYNPPYWFMLLVTSKGGHEASRWYIGRHVYVDLKTSFDGKADWYIDSCWKLAYSHRENGETISGSITTLLNSLLNGRRIRIVFDSFSMEADNIVIDNGLVIAQLLSQVETSTIKTFMFQDAAWKWVRIVSDGTYYVDRYDVGAATSRGRDVTTISASWFAENRHWKLVLSMSHASIKQGAKSDLVKAVRSGSRVRCVIKESPTKTMIVTADNLEVNPGTGDTAAQFTRLITFDDTDPSFVPFWRILILSTKGEMTETHWTVGEHVKRGEVVTKVDIDWFVD